MSFNTETSDSTVLYTTTGSNTSTFDYCKPKETMKAIHYVLQKHSISPIIGIDLWIDTPHLLNKILHDPNFHSFKAHKKMKKEMTEASSQMTMLNNWFSAIYDQSMMSSKGSNYIIIDVCSGKGFFGVLASHILPNAHLILLDKNKKMNTKHFDSCFNLTFDIIDIRAPNFSLSQWIRDKYLCISIANQYHTKYEEWKLILVGTHLCGELSMVMIDAFNELSDIGWCLSLVPCCFPKRHKICSIAKQLNMSSMEYWLEMLQMRIQKSEHLLVESMELTDMLSEKNILIRCLRSNMHKSISKSKQTTMKKINI